MAAIGRRELLALGPALLIAGRSALAQAPLIEVVKDPGCGCCENWVKHLEKAGFRATVTESADLDAIKDRRGIPKEPAPVTPGSSTAM